MRSITPMTAAVILTTGLLFHAFADIEVEPQEVIQTYLTAMLAGGGGNSSGDDHDVTKGAGGHRKGE
jgi:hypothetical protein